MKATNENIRLLRPLFRGWPIIILMMVLCVIAAKIYIRYATPSYESTAVIRLADMKDGSPSANLYKDFDVFTSTNKIAAEIEVIKSRTIISKTLDKLDFDVTMYGVGRVHKRELYPHSPFKVLYKINNENWYDKTFKFSVDHDSILSVTLPESKNIIKAKYAVPFKINGAEITIIKNDSVLNEIPDLSLMHKFEFIINSRQKLVDFVTDNLIVTPSDKEVPILRLNYKSPVAQKAADLVNGVASAYVNDYIDTKVSAANISVNFLDEQLRDIGGKLSSSENEIQSYRDKNNIIDLKEETETDLRKIAEMKIQQTNVKMSLEAISNLEQYMIQGRGNELELAPNFEAYTDLLATELVKQLKLLEAEKKDLLAKYTPEYEEVKLVDAKIKDITTYLEEGIRNSRKNLQARYDRITEDIDEAQRAFDGLPEKEKTMGILDRNFSLNEQSYNFLHQKRTEAEIARAANISLDRIISIGEVAKEPVSPNPTLLKFLAAFLGFLGSVALIFMVHAIKGKVNSANNIEKKSAIPVAGGTPMLIKQNEIRNHFHKLAIQLEIKNVLQAHKILAISSFDDKEGKSYNAYHLAKEMALQNKKVLLVDVDAAMLAKGFAMDIMNVKYLNLADDIAKYSNSDSLKQQIEIWENEFDYIIIKNEPLNVATNGLMIMKLADANLFVVDSRRTAARMITEADLLQDEYKFNNTTFLLNRADYSPKVTTQVNDWLKRSVKKIRRKK